MTPHDAMQIIDQVLAQVSTTREGHAQLIQAVATVRQTIEASQTKDQPNGTDSSNAT